MKKTIAFLALMLPSLAFAQWRVGANVGMSYNHPTIDKQYMTDLVYKDRSGVNFGLMGQYDFNDWLGVRAELDWTQKNYRQTSFGFGGEQLRGFCNVGVYGGYWLNSHRKGTDFNNVSEYTYDFDEDVDFDNDRDQRWDCGLVGGLGLEYHFARHWGAQVEARYYYSTTSFRKEQPHLKDKRYHSTLGLQAGVMYYF